MKKYMKKRSFALLAVAACIVLAIPALAFGSAGMFSTENTVQAERVLDTEGSADQLDTAAPATNEQPESVQPSVDDQSAAVTNNASRSAATSQRFIDENDNGVCDRYEQGTCDSSWCNGEGLGQGRAGKNYNSSAGSSSGNRHNQACGQGYVDADGDGVCDNQGTANCGAANRGHHGRHS